MSTVLRVLSLVVVAITLSACGETRPGAAAVVDDRPVSMAQLDERARVMCLLESATQPDQPVDDAAVRQNAALMLVLQRVAEAEVERRHLAVDTALTELPTELEAQVRDVFGEDAEDVLDLLTEEQQLYAQLVTLGSEVTGQLPNSDILTALAQSGQELVRGAFDEHGVRFSPRLGIARDGSIQGGAGSLSVAPRDVDPAAVSPAVSCAA